MGHVVKNLKNQIVGLVACDNPDCPENSKVDLNQIFSVPPAPVLLAPPDSVDQKPE